MKFEKDGITLWCSVTDGLATPVEAHFDFGEGWTLEKAEEWIENHGPTLMKARAEKAIFGWPENTFDKLTKDEAAAYALPLTFGD